MSEPYRAYIGRENNYVLRDMVRLYVIERGYGAGSVLMADATWMEVPDGGVAEESGVLLPAASIEAIAKAIEEFQGHASHADTEARVLREWLAVERGRVDEALKR